MYIFINNVIVCFINAFFKAFTLLEKLESEEQALPTVISFLKKELESGHSWLSSSPKQELIGRALQCAAFYGILYFCGYFYYLF